MMFRFFITSSFFLALSACSDSNDKVEQVQKLRTLGVQSEPAAYDLNNPGDIKLTLFLVSPDNSALTISTFVDAESSYAPNIALNFDANQDVELRSYAALHIFVVKASISAGTIQDQLTRPGQTGSFRYGFQARQGEEEEMVVGNIVGGAAEQSTLNSVEISSPEGAQFAAEQQIEGVISSASDQQYRISWLASAGEISNRRALSTHWKKIPPTPQTLILTARGTRTGDFSYAVRDYNQDLASP